MKLKILGARGSRPTHKLNLLEFGGNSTSFQFVLDHEKFHIYLDGGSGLARQGMKLGVSPPTKSFHFLMTHTHWDHILGLPFFEPAYNPDNRIVYYSSKTSKATFENPFFGLQREAHLPVPLDKLKAKIEFQTVKSGSNFLIENEVLVKTMQINHQGITLGYRLESKNASVAIITDNAPIENGNHLGEGMKENAKSDPKAFEEAFNNNLILFLKDCHTVVFDTHFTEQNLKADWGHSTPQRALSYCRKAGVKRLILFHHAPEDSDRDVHNKVLSVLNEAREANMEVVAAKEGDLWTLS